MATTLHSFIDIFDTTFGEGPEAVQLKKIIIPIIQRDYAQGRKGSDVTLSLIHISFRKVYIVP